MKKTKLKFLLSTGVALLTFFSCENEKYLDEPGNVIPKTVNENPNLPSLNVNGAKLHVQAFGPLDSTLVICIHGGPGANFRYLMNCKSLSEKGYRVVFYDQRGSGLSERFSKDWYLNLKENAIKITFYDDLRSIIKHYKTSSNQKVVLLTQSWGSMLGTGYTGKYLEEIDGLILAEPGGLIWEDILEYVGKSRDFRLWSEELNDATYLDQFITGKENQHEIQDYKLALISSSNVIVGDIKSDLGTNDLTYKSARDGYVIGQVMFEIGEKYKPDFSEGISEYKNKVLFFYSGKNIAYPDDWAKKISSVYPNKDLIKIESAGHSGMFDQINIWQNETEPKVLEYLKNL